MNAPFLARVLRAYQQRAATYLYESDAAFLIAPLGAGKGAAALTAIAELIRDKHRRHALVIAPKLVATTVAARSRALAALGASAHRRSQWHARAPASAPRPRRRARGDGNRRRSRALAGQRARQPRGRSPAVRCADHRRDLTPQGP